MNSLSTTMTTAAKPPLPPRLHQSSKLGAEDWTQLVNQAGRQRMLSQRIILHAVLASQGDSAAAQVARDALALFQRSHDMLSRGHPELPMPADVRLIDAFHGPQGAEPAIREFIGLAEQALRPTASLRVGSTVLTRLTAQATPVLGVLQRLTQLYETLALDAAKAQRRQSAALAARRCGPRLSRRSKSHHSSHASSRFRRPSPSAPAAWPRHHQHSSARRRGARGA